MRLRNFGCGLVRALCCSAVASTVKDFRFLIRSACRSCGTFAAGKLFECISTKLALHLTTLRPLRSQVVTSPLMSSFILSMLSRVIPISSPITTLLCPQSWRQNLSPVDIFPTMAERGLISCALQYVFPLLDELCRYSPIFL